MTEPATPAQGACARVIWMFFGPMVLLLTAVEIAKSGNGWLTFIDGFYILILGAILLARYMEFRAGHPLDSSGKPSKPSDLPRNLLIGSSLGLAIWIVANLIGNHFLRR